MKCAEITKLMSLRADGAAGPAELRAVAEHAAGCAECAREAAALGEYGEMMRGVFSGAAERALSPDFDRAFFRRLAAEPPAFSARLRGIFTPPVALRAALSAATVAVAVAVAVIFGPAPAPPATERSLLECAVSSAEAAQAEAAVDRQAREILNQFL